MPVRQRPLGEGQLVAAAVLAAPPGRKPVEADVVERRESHLEQPAAAFRRQFGQVDAQPPGRMTVTEVGNAAAAIRLEATAAIEFDHFVEARPAARVFEDRQP